MRRDLILGSPIPHLCPCRHQMEPANVQEALREGEVERAKEGCSPRERDRSAAYEAFRLTAFIAARAATIVCSTWRSVWAADRNHASNCDGGG